MSHYSVIVIGPDHEAQLAPYNENLPDVENAKWDWYSVGGRWTGYFKVKKNPKYPDDVLVGEPGVFNNQPNNNGWADQLRKCDIDVEGMQRKTRQDAEKEYDEVYEFVKDCPKASTWNQMCEQFKKDGIDVARKYYHEQAFVKALAKSKHDPFLDCGVKRYQCSRDEFVHRAVSGVLVPFAVVWEGKWYEKGEMGWFGAVRDEKKSEDWNKEFFEMFSSLPGDTLVTMVDAHI